MVTNEEKNVYNTYLRISRTRKGVPYKTRKNFESFIDTDKHTYVRRLVRLFAKHTNIKWNDFFNAPYELYPDDVEFDLKFYTSPKAIKIYSMYMAKQDSSSPDNRIEDIKKTYMYIFKFCKQNDMCLDEYLRHMTNDLNTFILHIRNHDVYIAALFGLDNFENIISTVDNDRLEFTIGKSASDVPLHRTRFYSSEKAKLIAKQCADQIKKLLLIHKKDTIINQNKENQ